MNDAPHPHRIESLQNPQVKRLVRLREPRHRRKEGRFLIEGGREIARALASGWLLESLFVAEEHFPRGREGEYREIRADAQARGVPCTALSAAAFSKVAYRQGADGLLAVAPTRDPALERLPAGGADLLLLLEGVEKPGNLGALLRTADAAGVAAVVVTDPACDPFNPQVVRASQGSLFRVPVAVTDNASAHAWLADRGYRVAVTVPESGCPPWAVDLRGPVVVALGSEAGGLSDFWLAEADDPAVRITIPMAGMADSLNVSVAAAVVLYEAVRQREGA